MRQVARNSSRQGLLLFLHYCYSPVFCVLQLGIAVLSAWDTSAVTPLLCGPSDQNCTHICAVYKSQLLKLELDLAFKYWLHVVPKIQCLQNVDICWSGPKHMCLLRVLHGMIVCEICKMSNKFLRWTLMWHSDQYTAHAVALTKILSQPLCQNVLFSPYCH